jgi:hypothetical protein
VHLGDDRVDFPFDVFLEFFTLGFDLRLRTAAAPTTLALGSQKPEANTRLRAVRNLRRGAFPPIPYILRIVPDLSRLADSTTGNNWE